MIIKLKVKVIKVEKIKTNAAKEKRKRSDIKAALIQRAAFVLILVSPTPTQASQR